MENENRSSGCVYNVREYGALGNGNTKDTQAIQAAIDCCTQNGGGRVLLPAGFYLSGTIYLKDNVELHLAAGAVLIGSPHRQDYNSANMFTESIPADRYKRIWPSIKIDNAHLVVGHLCRNISITGQGTIDGHSSAFFAKEDTTLPYRYKIRLLKRGSWSWRPGQMVWICRCRQVKIKDIRLVNAPFWTVHLIGCEDVQVRGITIAVPPTTWNGDGINIECTRNVTVSDCIVRSSDDCITIKSGESLIPEHRFADGTEAPDCENMLISNCILSSPTRGILLGVGSAGRIRRCRFNNIVINDNRTGIGIRSRYYSPNHNLFESESWPGVHISDIHFSNFTLDCIYPFRIEVGYPGADPSKSGIYDLSFTNFSIHSCQKGEMLGQPQAPISRILFKDIEWHVRKDDKYKKLIVSGDIKPVQRVPAQECAFLVSDVANCQFEGIRLYWQDPDNDMRMGFDFHNAHDVEVKSVVLRQPKDENGSALRFSHSSKIRIKDCRAAEGTKTFLAIQDSPPGSNVHCQCNDFSSASTPVVSDVQVLGGGNIYGLDSENA